MARKALNRTITVAEKDWAAVEEKAKELNTSKSKLLITMALHGNLTKDIRNRLGAE